MTPLPARRAMIDGQSALSKSAQCRLLGLNRSGIYYGGRGVSPLNLELMRLMDGHYHYHPYKGAPRMHVWLNKDKGFRVSRDRVGRLYYEAMGLRAIIPGPHTSKRHKDHTVFPYLLRGLAITQPQQVWATDITYMPLPRGFIYLTAVIDLYSRYVLNWSLSNTMEAEWCCQMIAGAIDKYGEPSILNTDQGSQYTSELFSQHVVGQGVRLSMDGKGRATDNAFVERLWRTVKYEDARFKNYQDGIEMRKGMSSFFDEYNIERRHSPLDDMTPKAVYFSQR